MNLQSIKVSACYESETNPRGAFESGSFKELVASVKEKGVLIPYKPFRQGPQVVSERQDR